MPEVIPQGSTVVLCVGTPTGDDESIKQANVETPLAWANAAKAAGANHVVQLSSFAVYGGVEQIDLCTPEQPVEAYGISKLLADRSLAALADDGFAVSTLRVPMLFGGGGDDKLARLVATLARVRVIPAPNPPICRSMLGYAGLGEVVADIIRRRIDGVLHAAEPTPFSWSLVARVMRRNGLGVFELPVSASLTGLLRLTAPRIHARLFRSSVLDPQTNIVRSGTDGIEEAIASVLRSLQH
jgi:dTDP-4-dehydrorhamnose reductase